MIAPIFSLRRPNLSRYHFLQTRLLVWVVPTLGQALLMFLESVPVHLNRGLCSRLWGVPPVRKRNTTKQCLPVSPAYLLYFPWQPVGCAGSFVHTAELSGQHSGIWTVWHVDIWACPGYRNPAVAPAASRVDRWKSGVESACQFALRWKIQAVRLDRHRERRARLEQKDVRVVVEIEELVLAWGLLTPPPSVFQQNANTSCLCTFVIFLLRVE